MTTSCRPLLACHDSVISTFLLIVISVNVVTSQFLPFEGESISDRRYFPLNQSPFKINHDLIVTKTGQLIIEAGVEVQFSPRKGIYVEGALIAKGNENRKIVFTRLDSTASGAPNGNQHVISSTVQWPEARLVDGDLPSEGRLQLKLNDRWHSVCTNSRNWTKVDIDVLCKQIGFADGNWYNWFHRINDSRQLMFETPSCIGSERELQECSKWNMRQVGSGICDYHMDIGIRCSKRLVNSQQGFWSGIKFYNSKWRSSYSQVLSGRMRERSSDSVLEHVEVFYAGESSNGEATPAIESIGVPPVMSNIFVRWSASSAVNITNPGDGFKIVDSRIIENRGYGIFVNSSHGQVSLENVEVSSNGADGVRYAVREDLEVGEDFCRFASLGDNQVYPVRLTHEQNRYSQSRSRCCQEFKISNHVNRDAQLTVHFPYMMVIDFEGEEKDRKRVSDGIIEVQDGYQGTLVSKFVVRNDTKIPSVTSTQGRIRICYQPAILKKVLFTVVIVADNGRAYELNITRGDIRANNGRGVWITDQLTGSVVNHTVIANHSYVAGLHVASGCGNIIVNNSKIIDNAADGINITLSDGHRHIDRTTVSGNSGRGVALWFNESLPTSMEPSYAKPFVSQVTYSHIVSNGGVGVLMSNVCLSDSSVNISMNTFQGNDGDALILQSCWPRKITADRSLSLNITEVLVSHNKFVDNHRLAVRAAPFLSVSAKIAHNTFRLHRTGALYINNQDEIMKPYLYEDLSAEVNVTDNHFNENTGNFVANVGLQEGSDSQRMFFMRNVLEKNVISEPFPNLNPRSRVAAVLCVSSSNTQTVRNNLLNPNSRYEIGSHVEGHNLIINASLNFFGKRLTVDEKTAEIYSRIFDRKNRYNLAQVEFLPYRTRKMDFNTNELISYDRERDKFISIIKDQKLGGEIRGEFILEPGVYQVVDDIYVRPGAKFVIAPETTLNFDQSVGLMVQGKLEAVGRTYQQIRFTGSGTITNPAPPVITPPRANNVAALDSKFSRIMKAPTYTPRNTNTTNPPLIEIVLKSDKNKSNATVSQRAVDFQLPTNRTKRAIAGSTVRLSNRFEGKLEVLIDGQWGGVCSYGFDIIDAAIACQQMGLTLNSRDWLLETSQYANSYSHNAAISNLKCSLVDFDITSCPSEKVVKGDFTPSACPLEVGIRCHAPSWSGVRLGILADESVMEYAIIEKAGLLDYGANAFKPALQVDFMKHRLKNLTVSGNGDSGIGILWTDLFSDDDLVTLRGYRVANNFQHGIVSRSQGLRIVESEISGNRESGFHYEPMMDSTEQLELMSWIAPVQPDALIVYPTAADDQRKVIKLDQTRRSSWFLKLSEKPPKQFCSSVVIETGVGHSIGVIVLNPVSELATDRLSVSNIANSFSWDLKSNLSSFPMLTYAYKLNLTYCSGDQPRGGVMLYLSVKRLPSDIYARRDSLVDQERSENLRIKSIHLTDNFISRNGRGFSANHYSRDVGHLETDYGNYYHRHDNETIRLNNNVIERSTKESIYISAPFYEPREAALAEINYTLINNRVIENGRGIVQYSRDIRNSNNLFHWHLVANIIEENRGSGILIRLPYVWQFNENYTHSIVMADNTIIRNRNFMLLLGGHYAEVNITGNMFSDNHCHEGLFRLAGMEKKMRIEDNIFKENSGHFVVEFAIQSHADKIGLVRAEFRKNRVLRNKDSMTNRPVDMYHPKSYAIALHGIQFVNITRNLLNNPNLQFELLAGVLTGSLDNKLNAKENWWGYFAPDKISQRIFDFDDWNSYSVADFSPFLATEHFDAITVPVDHSQDDLILDLSRPLGGKISRHVLLQARAEPYIVKSDLTIMPGAALVIEADVVLEFYPSVGLLVLGEMTIAGYDSKPVIMRPVSLMDPETRFKRQAGDTSQNGVSERKRSEANELTNVRMCITESCSEWNENGSVKPRDGFLEVYNSTTLQWMAVCDERFTERNAQVVCRQLGYSSINAHLRRGSRYDVGPTMMSRVRYWPEPMECDGRENFVSECKVRLNGYGNHSHACTHNGDSFVYIFCGREPDSTYLAPSAQEGKHYWGGVRFARPRFEPNEHGVLRSDSNFRPSRIREQAAQSRIQHLNIIGAGILHGEKNAAIQLVQRDVNLEFVNVSDCAYHGIEVIAPSGNLAFHRLELRRNLGAGINYLLLGGASSGVATIPYKPLSTSTIPYNLYGLVDVCDTNKKLIVEERVIVYHKYDNHPVDCVKIFAATHSAKRLGFRVLQFNMFNSTNYAAVTDSIQIVDGDIFNQTSRLIGDLGVTEAHRLGQPELKFYSSTEATLSIRLHASGAASSYGFIAEVVTMPVSYYAGRGHFHNVTFSEISGNTMGAITYNAAGETAPSVAMDYNRFEYNCQEFHGNFTSCNSSIDLEIQNSPQFFFRNNLVTGNYGGLRLQVNAQSAAASLYGLLINNLFERNKNNEVLYVQGPQQGSYQVVEMANNYFTYNTARFKSNIVLDKVVANFTSNVIVANTGRHQLEVLGFEQVPISYQTIRGNWFYNNMAIGSGQFGYGLNGDERSTIFASNAGQRYVENYLVNPENDFELATMNRSDLYNYDPRAPSQTAIAYRKSSVDARENWWGFNESSAIASRVLEQSDYIDLVRVEYTPFHSSNHSVLSGICPGGWSSIGHTCFLYIGARMTFAEAQRFCERQNSTMPVVRANRRELTDFLYEQQDRYDHRFFRVWVQSFDFDVTECTVLVDTAIEKNKGGCYERLPFFCEKDPDIRVFIGSWYREPLGIAALAVSTVTAILTMCCLCCWMCKSREKAKEKLQRRNSIRASIRSNRSVIYSSNAGSINGIAYQKSYDKVLIAPRSVGSGSTQLDTAPLNSMSPVKYSRTGSINSTDNRPYVDEGEKVSYNPAAVRPRSAYRPLEDRFANDASLENANATLLAHPTFDLTFQNEAFQATPTPTASRASNMEYTEATDWTLQGTPPAPSSPPVKQLPAPPSPSYGEFPRQTPSPPTGTQRFNTYESAAAYETLPRRDLTFSTFGGVKVLPVAPPARPRPPPRIGGNFSTSQNSLLQGAGGSDITAATHLTTNTNRTDGSKRYLETSLDGDSIQENNYDYYDYRFRSIEQQRAQSRSSPSISILTASSKETSKSKPALETAM